MNLNNKSRYLNQLLDTSEHRNWLEKLRNVMGSKANIHKIIKSRKCLRCRVSNKIETTVEVSKYAYLLSLYF